MNQQPRQTSACPPEPRNVPVLVEIFEHDEAAAVRLIVMIVRSALERRAQIAAQAAVAS
jgi:hypothetical protein